jgi:arsenate reductase
MATILFLCTGNSCRSQMAEGFAKHFHGGTHTFYSAGIETHGLIPNAVRVMAEAGVPIDAQQSELVQKYIDEPIEYVVTVCDHARETCPVFPKKAEIVPMPFRDPPRLAKEIDGEENKLAIYREVRDEIQAAMRELPTKLGL